MTEPESRLGAFRVIGRSVEVAPSLRSGFAGTFALAAVGAGARVAIPILLQQAIDRGISGGDVRESLVAMLSLIGACVVVIASVCQRAAVVRLGSRSEQALYGLRVALFGHIHQLSLADHAEEKRGSLVSRVTSDIEQLQQFFSWGALAFLLDGTLMVVVAMVMLSYDWMLALVVFAIASPLVVLLSWVQKRLVKAYEETRHINAGLLGTVSEMVSGAPTLHAYEAQDGHVEQVVGTARKRTKAYVRASIFGAVMFPMGEVFAVFCVCGVLAVGVLRGPDSGLTAGALVSFIFLTYRFLEPVGEFTEVFDQTQSAVASLRRVVGVLDTPIGPPPAEVPIQLPTGRLGIEAVSVDFSYRSRSESSAATPVLHDVNLAIPPGQVVALVGHTGSGKTTLGRLFARFADPDRGRIVIGGVDLKDISNEELRRRLMVVPQEPFLFDDSIAANLRFADPDATDERCRAAFAMLDLVDWLDSLPMGLDTRVGERGESLSAGERQLVALGRAALVDPDVLILDEATSSVDALTEVRLTHALDRLTSGRTTVAIAHRLSTAARADNIVVLDHGRIVEHGSHAQLLARNGMYAAMYQSWIVASGQNGALSSSPSSGASARQS